MQPSGKGESKGRERGYFKMEHVFIRFAAGTDHRIAGHANPRGHEVRVRGCEIPHAEPCTEAALADGPLHPQQPGDARGRPFALPDASLRSCKFSSSLLSVHLGRIFQLLKKTWNVYFFLNRRE